MSGAGFVPDIVAVGQVKCACGAKYGPARGWVISAITSCPCGMVVETMNADPPFNDDGVKAAGDRDTP